MATPDQEFVEELRAAIEVYFAAVDQWEAAYQKYYRLPGYAARISEDLETEHREYRARRKELEPMLPRARRLCLKHDVRDAFSGLQLVSLGRYAPQERTDSAIGRNQRNAITQCLLELKEACREADRPGEPPSAPARNSFLQRLFSYFY